MICPKCNKEMEIEQDFNHETEEIETWYQCKCGNQEDYTKENIKTSKENNK